MLLKDELNNWFSQGVEQIRFDDGQKPIMAPVCMFLTSIQPEDHCEARLVELGSGWRPDAWREPIEVGPDGRLGLVA